MDRDRAPTDADLSAHSSDPAFSLTADGKIASWNEKAREAFGFSAAEVVGSPCWKVVRAVLPDGERVCVPNCEGIARFAAGEPGCAHECMVMGKDGERTSARLASLALPEGLGNGAVGLIFLRPVHSEPTGHTLRISTLGPFELTVGDQPVHVQAWERKQALRLLQFLVCRRGRPVHRDQLIESFWPEAEERRGRERLKVTVHALRKYLRAADVSGDVVMSVDESYLLGRARVWVDADAFESLVEGGIALDLERRRHEAVARYQEASEFYRGDFLEGLPYDDWCEAERHRLRELYLDALSRLSHALAAVGDLPGACEVSQRALAIEPALESFHRALMDHLWRQGRRDEALMQYHRLRQILIREVGVEPGLETQHLHRQILQSRSA